MNHRHIHLFYRYSRAKAKTTQFFHMAQICVYFPLCFDHIFNNIFHSIRQIILCFIIIIFPFSYVGYFYYKHQHFLRLCKTLPQTKATLKFLHNKKENRSSVAAKGRKVELLNLFVSYRCVFIYFWYLTNGFVHLDSSPRSLA